jgi:hypothetical protein
MKNVLSNLTQSEKNRILEMHKSATRKLYLKESTDESVDMSSVNTSINNLNAAITNIPNRNKDKDPDNPAVMYLNRGYFINLYDANAGYRNDLFDLKTSTAIDRTLKDTTKEGRDYFLIETPKVGIGLFKQDPGGFVKNNFGFEDVYGAAKNGNTDNMLPHNLDEHKKNLQEAITSGVNSKDKELAEQKLNEIYTLLDTLVSDLTNVINGLPDGKVLVMSNISGYQINLYDNGDPRVSYGTTGDNQKY